MKYLIVSDIHGCLPTLEKVLTYFEEHKCDMLCILGDILNYGPRNGLPEGLNPSAVADRLNAYADRIIAIRGNCDSEVDQMLLNFPMMADYAVLVDNGKRLFLTHGHIYNEQNMPSLAIDAFFYGHTHLKKVENNAQGVLVCNTGSITFPKGGNPKSFAVYENGNVELIEW